MKAIPCKCVKRNPLLNHAAVQNPFTSECEKNCDNDKSIFTLPSDWSRLGLPRPSEIAGHPSLELDAERFPGQDKPENADTIGRDTR